jgi:hypothetical protein
VPPSNGPKPRSARGESEPDAKPAARSETRQEPEPKPAPKPRNAAVEPSRQPEGEGTVTREDPAKRLARTPPVSREDARGEPARGEGEAAVSKLRLYGAAGSDVKVIERSAARSKKLESFANSGAGGEAVPAGETGATNAVAAPPPADDASAEQKRQRADKKKKDAAVTPAPSASAPAAHTAHRPPTVIRPLPGNN